MTVSRNSPAASATGWQLCNDPAFIKLVPTGLAI